MQAGSSCSRQSEVHHWDDYEARRGSGIGQGSIRPHPGGHPHGSYHGAYERSIGAEF